VVHTVPSAVDPISLFVCGDVMRSSGKRRWLSSAGLVADLLVALTPLETPLLDTGNLRADLMAVVARAAATVAAPMSQAMLALVAGAADGPLALAAAEYWASLFQRTAEVIRRAQRRGDADPIVDAVDAIGSLLAPIYLRALDPSQKRGPSAVPTAPGIVPSVVQAPRSSWERVETRSAAAKGSRIRKPPRTW